MNTTFTKLLTRFSALYSQGWYAFDCHRDGVTLVAEDADNGSTSIKPLIVVLGRSHYKEWSKEYKAPTTAALKKIVKLELAAKAEDHIKFEIHKPVEGISRVTFWQPEPEVMVKLPSSVRWLVPESYLMAQPDTIVAAQTPASTLYVAQQIGVSSSSNILGCRNVEHFQWMSGVSHSAHQQMLDLNQYSQVLIQALGTKVAQWFSQFSFQKPRDYSDVKRQIKPALVIAIGITAVYMAGSSVYLHWYHQNLLETYQGKKEQINQVLSTQQTVQQQLLTLKQGEQTLNGLELTAPTWQVVLALLELDVRITQINYDKSLVILRGNAASATELLTLLTQHPLVQDAKFINAVSRQRNRDRFSISFQLNHDADWKQADSQEEHQSESLESKPQLEGESS